MRRVLKQAFEKGFRVARGHPRRMAGRSLVLAYHNVVPDQLQGHGDRSLHLAQSAFLRQLDLLAAHCEVLPLDALLAGKSGSARPRVAITFDDAYRGAVEFALPELARRGLPGTLFVAPGLLGDRSFWWDELASGPDGLDPDTRRNALERDAGQYQKVREQAARQAGGEPLPECYGCAREAELRALAALRGLTFGAHTWGHPNLARLDASALVSELGKPQEWFRAAAIPLLPILAYPYGLASPEVERAAERAGYTAALLVEGGWIDPAAARPWAVPRYNVPAGLSDDGFVLRLSGFLAS